jgi:glycosyltransferase involved in cell wall biosynthesis
MLRKIASRLAPRAVSGGVTYADIGSDALPRRSPRAIVFNDIAGVQRLVEGKWPHDPVFKKHTIKGDTVSMVRQLNRHGYVVDYCDLWRVTGNDVDWSRYSVVVDNLDNLKYAPEQADLVKIHFANYNHWLFSNSAELERVRWFRERTGITVPANRQMPSVLSDEHADYLANYGTDFFLSNYSTRPTGVSIDLCALCGEAPAYEKKDMTVARSNFLWLGGGGMLCKGLDLVMEAFAKMPEAHLYIGGNAEAEPEFWSWARQLLAKYPNLHYLGWVDTTSPEFDQIADRCIGIVYPSATEGGPASVARLLFNGCLPIVTRQSNVRAQSMGHMLHGANAQELIDSIIDGVRLIAALPDKELIERSQAVREFALAHHTREAFDRSFSDLIGRTRNNTNA